MAMNGAAVAEDRAGITCIVLLDFLHIGHFVVRIVSCLPDFSYSSGGLASVGR